MTGSQCIHPGGDSFNGGGKTIARSNNSCGVSNILNPVKGYRDELVRRGIAPRNHERENIRKLRLMQQKNRKDKLEKANAKSEHQFKMKKFQQTSSKVLSEKMSSISISPTSPRAFLRKGDGGRRRSMSGPTLSLVPTSSVADQTRRASIQSSVHLTHDSTLAQQFMNPSRRIKVKAPVPTRAELQHHEKMLSSFHKSPQDLNHYINTNARKVIDHHQAPETKENLAMKKHKHYGQVPAYILTRKEQWAKEELTRRANLPDPACPRGMKLMVEADRVETLKVLRESQEEAQKQLSSLPLHVETPGQVRKKNLLEAKMKEIEDAILIFDRPKVFIAAA